MPAFAQIPASINTPDKVDSLGTLEYKDGAPSEGTVAKAYDYLDLMHGVEAFVNAYQGASVASIFKGCAEAGIPNNTATIFSELMDAKSLFLTANADTVYFFVGDRATEFGQRCRQLGIKGVTLHSYRYAWAERAKTVGYPERFLRRRLCHIT